MLIGYAGNHCATYLSSQASCDKKDGLGKVGYVCSTGACISLPASLPLIATSLTSILAIMADRKGSLVVDPHNVKVTTVFGNLHEQVVIDENATLDEKTLGALGYKQEFKRYVSLHLQSLSGLIISERDFSIWETFSVSFSVLGLLPSIASTLGYGLGYSGTGGLVWGYLIASIFIQATAFSMAELCSSMPTAGGLYYASAVLAPEGWGPICSW